MIILCLPRGYAVLTDDPIQTGLSVGVDVNMQDILPVRQEPVGSPAHQDAGPLLRQFPDGDSQSQERLIIQELEKGTAAWLEQVGKLAPTSLFCLFQEV